jgi:hypothetical protein
MDRRSLEQPAFDAGAYDGSQILVRPRVGRYQAMTAFLRLQSMMEKMGTNNHGQQVNLLRMNREPEMRLDPQDVAVAVLVIYHFLLTPRACRAPITVRGKRKGRTVFHQL